jgi:anti-sigma regulatory factor (Ser/Thr protein kinase)
LCVEVTDEGAGFDLIAVRAMSEDPDWATREDGRGVFLMHALMDKVETWCDRGHTVRLVLRRT